MPTSYTSIKEDVLKKLEENLEEIRARFGIETIGIFGSVARGDDTAESDVDILYRIYPDKIDYLTYLDLHDSYRYSLGEMLTSYHSTTCATHLENM